MICNQKKAKQSCDTVNICSTLLPNHPRWAIYYSAKFCSEILGIDAYIIIHIVTACELLFYQLVLTACMSKHCKFEVTNFVSSYTAKKQKRRKVDEVKSLWTIIQIGTP